MTFHEKEEILAKATYGIGDIMTLESCSQSKAYRVIKAVKDKGGAIPFRAGVDPATYWRLAGSSLDEQLRQVGIVLGRKEKSDEEA